jgi:hypothetical protein
VETSTGESQPSFLEAPSAERRAAVFVVRPLESFTPSADRDAEGESLHRHAAVKRESVSLEIVTSSISSGVSIGLAKVFIPGLHKCFTMISHHRLDRESSVREKPPLLCNRIGSNQNFAVFSSLSTCEDRYHATAVQADEHLYRCMIYIDLNMVRAGVVNHPEK